MSILYVQKFFWGTLATAFGVAGFAVGLAAFLSLMGQAIDWLKTGVWTAYPLSQMLGAQLEFREFKIERVGARKIALWLLDTPAVVWVTLLAIILLVITASCAKRAENAKHEIERRRNGKP